jgi:hypothetical protein
MKNIILLSLFFSLISAKNWISINSKKPSEPTWSLTQNSESSLELLFEVGGYYLEKLSNGENRITFPGGVPILEEGSPQLPRMTRSVIIPDNAKMSLLIMETEYLDIPIESIVPSKGNLTRNIDPSSVPFVYGDVYKKDEFYPSDLSFMRDPYIMRSVRGQTIVIQPFQFNPIQGILRVYTHIRISVEKDGDSQINVLNKRPANGEIREFQNMYKEHFLNYSLNNRYETLGEQGSMLIISYGAFMDQMQPFVDWKNYKGIPTSMINVSEIGDVDQMEQYIEERYYEDGIAYVLLVGDIDEIDAIRRNEGAGSNSPSDNTLSFVAGNDAYPDLIIGRFSAENTSHVQTMVNRTIAYEMNPDPNSDWYKKGAGFASDQGPGDDGEYDDEHMDVIRELLLSYTYTEVDQIYDPSGTVADGEEAINEGRSIINYTGHGSNGSWGNGCPMNNTNVNGLSNFEKWPFIWSVACVNGEFEQGTCFAETWLRATGDDGEPTGAIATLMSTVNQAWNPPMDGQDEMNAIYTESFDSNVKRTFGGLSFNGMNQMNDDYGSQGYDETYYWTIFGDPSVVLRSDTPTEMSVSHSDVIIIGGTSISIETGESDALVAVSREGVLIASGLTDLTGSIILNFDDPLDIPGPVNIIVTAFNKMPYENTINVIAPDGAYLLMTDFMINENNQQESVEFGQQGSIYFNFQNVGQDSSHELTFTLMHDSSLATIITENINHDPVGADDDFTVGPFYFQTGWNVQNNANLSFIIEITDSLSAWSYDMSVNINAPEFSLVSATYSDNGNGSLDPGETTNIEIVMHNHGDANINYPTFGAITSDEYLTIGSVVSDNAYWWGIDENITLTIEVSADSETPIGYTAMTGIVIGSLNTNFESVYPFPITLGVLVEDFETQSFTSFDWINGGDSEWIIDEDSYSGFYSARSGEIGDDQVSELSLLMNVLYEGEISFWAKISSESSGNDFLEFYINNQPQSLNLSGTSDWQEYTISLPVGTHMLRWIYQKNDFQSSNDDCAWIDLIQFPPGAVSPLNINFGDLNSDSYVNILDVIVTVNSVIGFLDLSSEQLQNADINLDGVVNIIDVLMIVDIVLDN